MLTSRRFQVFFLLFALAGPVLAQTNADSPYSRFGLGLMNQPGFARNRALGGIGIGLRDNRYINYLNPASCTAIDTMSFLFDFGIMGHYTYTETSQRNNKFYGANMDHLALAFPITKWWAASISVLPYSKVGYSIQEEDYNKNIGFIEYLYTGNGGVNQLNLGTSIELFNRFSLGANFKYLFGSIDLTRSVSFPKDDTRSYTKVESRTIVSDFIIDLGIQYSQDFLEKYNLTVGMIFDNKTSISAENRILKQNIFPGSTTAITDSTILNPVFVIDQSTVKGNIVIPTNLGAGFTFSYANKIRLGFDYYNQDWSKSTFFYSDQPLANSNSFYGGLEVVPDPEALKGYHKHIAYRVGGHYQNSYLQLEGEQLKDYGISFGVGLPLRNTKSSFNLACELGRRGTLENNLIRENYMFLSFSVTLHDFWFIKRKFD
jgi:hypothetical protein